MKRFGGHPRIQVTDVGHPMYSKFGTVTRPRFSHDDAWVAMEDLPPTELRRFPADDPHGRGYHILLFPDQCTPVVAA